MQVVLKHVSKTYPNGVRALDDLSLHVADGERMAIVGPSGCGKTTTLRLIAGLETVDRGTIAIGSRVVNDLAPRRRQVAMVFQSPALYPHLTVYGNLAFALRLRRVGREETEARVRRAADLLEISPLLDRRPAELSGGERQRVAIGRAIVGDPACFLFDEPLSHLDPRLREELRGQLKQLHAELAVASLYVTHDQEEAMTLGDRIAVLDAGRLQQVGSPSEIYDRPVNRFVAGFFGSPRMSFLEGTIVEEDHRLWFQATGIRLPLDRDLRAQGAQKITLGIRPEAVLAQPASGELCGDVAAQVVEVEPLGDRVHVHFACGPSQRLAASWSPPTAPSPGTTMTVYLDLRQAHYFDSEGAALRGDSPR